MTADQFIIDTEKFHKYLDHVWEEGGEEPAEWHDYERLTIEDLHGNDNPHKRIDDTFVDLQGSEWTGAITGPDDTDILIYALDDETSYGYVATVRSGRSAAEVVCEGNDISCDDSIVDIIETIVFAANRVLPAVRAAAAALERPNDTVNLEVTNVPVSLGDVTVGQVAVVHGTEAEPIQIAATARRALEKDAVYTVHGDEFTSEDIEEWGA